MTAASEAYDPAPAGAHPTGADDIAAARRVLAIEARALDRLAATLPPDFARAVDALGAATGRIVLSGMGKSGHIARKIAATLASTGAPALYIHPGEASHGDLGMIAPAGDVVMVLSNSGTTPELADIVTHAKRFRVPLISIVGPDARRGAFAVDQADLTLALPAAPEACPMGLAPTTSTTMMLALGDALAIALLERRAFTAADFSALHPGGRLGRAAVVRVRDIMHTGDAIPLVAPDTAMSEVIVEMTTKSLGCAGIVDAAGRLLGIITDGDLRRHMAADLLTRESRDVMTAGPRIIAADALASEALGLMNGIAGQREITSLFVVEGQRPVGIVHIHDCYRAGVA